MWFCAYKQAPRQKTPVVLQAEPRAGAALLHSFRRSAASWENTYFWKDCSSWRVLPGTEALKKHLEVLQFFSCWASFMIGLYVHADEPTFILAKLHYNKMKILDRLFQSITWYLLKSSKIYSDKAALFFFFFFPMYEYLKISMCIFLPLDL